MRYELNGDWYNIKELSEKSGVLPHTIRDRLRRGYTVEEAVRLSPVHDCVKEFCNASWYEDWIGMSINDLYENFWKWCISNGYKPIQKQGFSRQLFTIYPELKTVPTKKGDRNFRIIRKRG